MSLPFLALALGAAAASRLRLDERAPQLSEAFVPAVGAMDAADRDYRSAIERTLSADAAGAMLTSMAAFRGDVHAIRERTRAEIDQLYRRGGGSYGWFDPLDAAMPFATGLNHVDGMRAATIADTGRAEVAALRARVNDAVASRLLPDQIEALTAAKRQRRAAFEDAIARALATVTDDAPAAAVDHLVQLADGWY